MNNLVYLISKIKLSRACLRDICILEAYHAPLRRTIWNWSDLDQLIEIEIEIYGVWKTRPIYVTRFLINVA